MDYQELLKKYITERQESEQKLVGGEVIELTLFASWLNKNAAQQSVQATEWWRCSNPECLCRNGNDHNNCVACGSLRA